MRSRVWILKISRDIFSNLELCQNIHLNLKFQLVPFGPLKYLLSVPMRGVIGEGEGEGNLFLFLSKKGLQETEAELLQLV